MTNEIEHSGVVALGDGSVKARDAAIKAYEYWLGVATKEEAFDHAIAEYLILTAALSTRPAQEPVAVPEGWKLVPIEPTDQMISAGIVAYDGKCESSYRAMVAANSVWEDLRADIVPEMPMVIEAVNQSRARKINAAAPQPVINPTHSQVAGTRGLLTETAPTDNMEAGQ